MGAVFNGVSALLALVAAGLWLKASSIPTPQKIDAIVISDMGFEGDLPKLFQGVAAQSKWNRWAAGVAGLAALAQAAGTIIH